ncbi:hypothetical protein D3C87_1480140 [compost metagenome]|jgi:hypothetical protein|uniref:Immunity protein n=1 Tax=Serratia liquefaciens TaxID=614 RepID=A0ABX7D5R7_SERLI|nr:MULTISPECIES: hypothetical protein [Serratia]MCS4320233.1 hypothetical protein [Serratia sp. BIGb0234]QQU54908.1 hypothetical protein I6I38_21855 [Serratia liquefaciens]CAI2502011.1 Uncharacterised protein [Serratia liquefaciens]CAI2508508.1 Uncharacterised protein [Serratia liquefaciens]
MIDLERLANEEKISDVIAFLVRREGGFGYQQMDRFFSRHNFSVIENGEFMRAFEQLRQNGVVMWGDKMLVKKGPNWKEPKFVTEKKYGIE